MNVGHSSLRMLAIAAICTLSACAKPPEQATDAPSAERAAVPARVDDNAAKGYSPYADTPPDPALGRVQVPGPTQVYWGDQHLHTAWSGDASPAGTRVTPDEALRLASGAQIISSTKQKIRLSRPLDWLVVSDHSDSLGMAQAVIDGAPELMKDPVLKEWNRQINAGGREAMSAVMDIIKRQSLGTLPKQMLDQEQMFGKWREMTAIVERHNKPGTFTALIGYEWTSNAGGGDNLHRNIIYRDGKSLADQLKPLTTFETENPEKLWEWLATYERKTGGKVLAIPHNGNLSNGRMFELRKFEGGSLDAEWASTRARWEPLYEVTQGKGTSEQHPSLAPNDEFANFEIWDKGNLNVVPKKPGMLETEYAREALKNGLVLHGKHGTNPFQFGFAGGTDAHTGVMATEENNFFGKFPASEPSAGRWNENAFEQDGRIIKGWELGASGLTAVWARENTREALWDAMKRREVYATSGSRILVRFFGGWNFSEVDATAADMGQRGYTKGVPMGAELAEGPSGKSPTFLVVAMKDPIAGNLDRIQIVKGWLDAGGKLQEKVYDVAWSNIGGARKPGSDGKVPAIRPAVNPKDATWDRSVGSTQLQAAWTDPDFRPDQRAFYYARIIEVPTPRWTAYDAKFYGIDMGHDVRMTVQDRAYTSPIWYQPRKSTLAAR